MSQQTKIERSKMLKRIAQEMDIPQNQTHLSTKTEFMAKMDEQEIVFQKLGSYWYAFTEQNGDPFFARIEPSKFV